MTLIGLSVWIFVTAFGICSIVEGVRERQLHGTSPVTGYIRNKEAISLFGLRFFERSKFVIKVKGTNEEVQAITGRYLLDQIPDVVRFYYSGDPSREVFLFEYEEDPLWIGLACVVGFNALLPFLPWAQRVLNKHTAEKSLKRKKTKE
jgi:hypothetical protein